VSVPPAPALPDAVPSIPADEVVDLDHELDRAIARLQIGFYEFSAPTEMEIEDQADVIVNVGREDDAQLHKDIGDAGVQAGTLKIASVMSAELHSNDFDIFPESEKEQVVDDDDGGQWKWKIKPRSEGKGNLSLTLNVVIANKGGDRRKTFASPSKVIPVTMTVKHRVKRFAADHWGAALGALFAPPPLVLSLWAILRRRRPDEGFVRDDD
jgi:hypothetical protein